MQMSKEERQIPEPPDITSLQPRMMTAAELERELERLFDWIHAVEASPEHVFLRLEESVESIRNTANELLAERRDRHSDEHAPRGG